MESGLYFMDDMKPDKWSLLQPYTPSTKPRWIQVVQTSCRMGEDGQLGLAALIHDEYGAIVAAQVKCIQGHPDPFLGESLALETGMNLLKEGSRDNAQVVWALNSKGKGRSKAATTIHDIKKTLYSTKRRQVNHIFHQDNQAVHNLAHHSLWITGSMKWTSSFPLVDLSGL